MSAHPPAHVSDPEGLAIHRQLLDHDLGALEALFTRYFEPLRRIAVNDLRDEGDRDAMAHDLVMDLFMSMVERPQQYDPDAGKSLHGYLIMALKGDVKNHKEKMWRQNRRLQRITPRHDDEDVGDADVVGNIASDDPTPEEAFLDEEDRQAIRTHAALIKENVVKTPEEAIVFDLQYVHGVKATAIFAEHLGIAHRSESEQAADVLRIKDRLDKRIKRLLKDRA